MAKRGGRRNPEVGAAETALIRLDKWIWFARFLRAREACADLVRDGHVRVNGRRVSQPGGFIRLGDVLTLALPGATHVVQVIGLAERRGDTEAAAALYRPVAADTRQTGKNE